jgi:CheY-like chemotaxis protein
VNGHKENSDGGLGIGLSLVLHLVDMHGGSVTARSDGIGRGSEFVVRLPIAAALATPSHANSGNKKARPTSSRRILVVDDNRDAATSLTMLLKIAGHETQAAHDGLEAVDVAETFRPDVVLVDISLPRMNGFDVCRRIRQQPWGKDMTLVALTGWGQNEDRQMSKEAGFDHHLVKPVDFNALMETLTE